MFNLIFATMGMVFAIKALSKVGEVEALIQQKRRELEDVQQNCRWNEQYIKNLDEKSYIRYDELRRKVNGTSIRHTKISNI